MYEVQNLLSTAAIASVQPEVNYPYQNLISLFGANLELQQQMHET